MRFYLLLPLLLATATLSAQITDSTQKVIPDRANSAAQEKKPYVILISADGFRHDLADKYQATHLQALRATGVQATAMTPAYPSVTFPNHYSLATGLYPSHHGLVDNTFFDRQKGRGYRISDRVAVEDSSFYGCTPIWVLAEQQKMLSASFFWVGSETAIDGIRPTYYYRFNDKISVDTRLKAVKDWLTLPEAQRPHLITFYLSYVDHAEHLYGPNSKEAEDAVHLVDDIIGRMTQMVDSLHLPVNYVFVSDHGMAQVDTTRGISLPAVIDTAKFVISFGGTMVHLYAKDKKDVGSTYKALKLQEPTADYYVYLPNETPAHWHYTDKDDRYHRIGDILLVAHFPLIFHNKGRIIPGEHGYDNTIPDMGATFYAWGPAFKSGLTITPFENVNVYPLIAHLLGLTITQPIDGTLQVLENTLRPALFAQLPPSVLTPADKVYGLSKFWQEVNYNFVYLDKIDRRAWDSTYRVMITRVLASPDDYSYWRLMQKFCATLHDGHTNVWMPGPINNLVLTKMFGPYWLGTENIDGKAIVTHTLKARMKEIPIGSEVIEVNGLPVAQYVADSVKPYISSSTGYVLDDWAIANLLQGPTGASYRIKLRRPDGTILPLELTHARTADTAFFPPLANPGLLELRWYDKDIAYLALNSFGDQKIDSLFIARLPELYKAKALIVDLRANGGGSTGIGTSILQYLTTDTVLRGSRSFTREHRAAFKAWGAFLTPADTLYNDWNKKAWLYNHDAVIYPFEYGPDTIHLAARRLVVPTAILIGHNTASAAEDFLIAASEQKHMIFVGDRSFGSTGQPFQFDLPGGGGARVCTKKDTYPDGTEFVGYGVAPAITVKPTVQDFIAHRDPVLEKSLDYLHQQLKQKKQE